MTTRKPPQTIDDLFDFWLSPEDINRPVTVTVKRAYVDEVYNPRRRCNEWKGILDFGRTKALILNKTQASAMADITGSRTITDWTGTRIVLFPDTASNGKDTIGIDRTTAAPMTERNEGQEVLNIDDLR